MSRRERKPHQRNQQGDSVILAQFQAYSQEYDVINDRRERLVKRSRDITIGSKRLIFLLHRIWENAKEDINKQADAALQKIHEDIRAVQQEIAGLGYWRYEPAFSPGLQEYIEAVSFLEFLLNERLITMEEINERLRSPENSSFSISMKDYILGVADMTGELMRLAVTSAANGNMNYCHKIRAFMQAVYTGFQCLEAVADMRDFQGKLEVMAQSVQKVDSVCFKIALRQSEFPNARISLLDDDDDEPRD